ncbi:MAG: helix-turn-helix domain-containing protein [Tannerellaceae bacterium]|jgi:AraC-like DNA-binding protein|nr:helix-turn-helix domain-containing protein [Tannerellaceae bacterium]
MVIQNVNIHLNCACYQKGEKQLITLKEYAPNETGQSFLTSHLIIFVLEGSVKYFIQDSETSVTVHSGNFIFFPATTLMSWTAQDKTTVLMFRLGGLVGKLPECHTFRFQRFRSDSPFPADPTSLVPAIKRMPYPLEMNERLAYFVEGVKQTESDGLKCSHFAEFLIGQLLTMIQVYYPREEYVRFYSTVATPNVAFADQVYENWLKCRSAGELANVLNMTLPQLRLNFLKVFREAPGTWLQNRRKEYIYYDICSSHKSVSQIAAEHEFSLSNFNRYCRMNYGSTAAEIREGLTVNVDILEFQ